MHARTIGAAILVVLAATLLTPSAWAHDSGFGLVRYMPDGALDVTFGNGGKVVVRSAARAFVANTLALEPTGKVLLGGFTSDTATGIVQLAVARYNSDGTPDLTFGNNGMVSSVVGEAGGQVNALAVQPDGMLVIAGTAFGHRSADRTLVGRYTWGGVLDSSFGSDGMELTQVGSGGSSAAAVTLQPDGRILVAGTAFSNGPTDDDFAIVRYARSGRLDSDFGQSGIVTTDFGTRDHATDTSLDRAAALSLQPDGRIIVAGFTRGQSQSLAAARYMPNGALDPSFGRGGLSEVPAPEPQVSSVVLEPSGAIVLAGSSMAKDRGTAPFALVRLRADGAADAAFGRAGLVSTALQGSRSGVRAIAAVPDDSGRLVVGGAKFGAPSASGDAVADSGFAFARYSLDGSLDTSFGDAGWAVTRLGDAGATPIAVAVQPDGKIVAAGLVFFQAGTTSTPSWLEPPLLPGVAGIAVLCISAGVIVARRYVIAARARSLVRR